jgi:hypothetical protein
MATIFKIRRDTAANWASGNPTLAAGEMGLDQTNNFIKMGDGSTAWNSLAQFTQNIENVEDLVGAMVTSNTETFITVTYDDSDGTLDFVVPVLDEDNLSTDSATHLATQQSIKAYVDGQTHLSLLDEDNMASNSATQAASQQSIKAYVDAQVDTEDTLAELDDVTLTTPADGSLLLYDTGNSVWIDNIMSGDATLSDTGAITLATVNSNTGAIGSSTAIPIITTNAKGLVTAVSTASITTSLTVGADSGSNDAVALATDTLDFSGGTGIDTTVSDNDISIAIDATVATLAGSQTLTNKTLTSPVLNTGVSGTAVKDEDNMASNSATHLATQQSIKAYVDSVADAQDNTDEITEGSTNLYFTNARARAAVSVTDAGGDGSLAYNSSTGVITYTGPSAAEARAHISVTDAGGDGSAAYNSSTGVITYTGPSAAEVRAHISAGTGVAISNGAISIGQAVATSSDVQFADLVLSGDLTINGTTTTVASTNTTHTDALIEYATGTTGTPANDAGIVIERGDQNNAFIGYDESADEFTMGTGSFTGASTGNLTITTGTLNVGQVKATSMALTGAVTTNSTFDGRDVATDGAKLDNIEASATADQTGAQIKVLYEAESSAFTDAQFTKLANIETAADVTDATNVNAAGALMLSDTSTSGLGIVVDEDNLVSDSATKVPTQQSVKAYVDAGLAAQNHLNEMLGNMDDIDNGTTFVKTANNFTDALKTSLDTMEDNADVTDATNVAAAGAVMESGDTASAKIPAGTTAQRDGSPSAGYFRWNTTSGGAEIFDGTSWGLVGGGNTTGKAVWEHSYTVAEDYEVTSGNNALTAGPITINTGYSVTVPSGSSWVIV